MEAFIRINATHFLQLYSNPSHLPPIITRERVSLGVKMTRKTHLAIVYSSPAIRMQMRTFNETNTSGAIKALYTKHMLQFNRE